ncbi:MULTISPECIES: hypothetical protein [Chitinophaga]|uniref:hypothetical protein n=1 Tax=Chitinophaga TaxID=79328 RepID=UPI000DB90459|nr:hypothetical protein [Chitinophaga ginsengisegetis]MDR6565348.1 hypothetical protein [Chitinophaga ginsengisegetis]MDR6645076.1 hypothetical protein [Chitinophaga ginsengisegetis]MDR6652332.1 hypothetical protein [Chitinophaga ginsengisegetis]
MSMKNITFFFIIIITASACSTRNHRPGLPRLTTISIQGDSTPQYTFRYDQQGNLAELVHHLQLNDTSISTFSYDHSHRITGMVLSNRENNITAIKERAKVTSWDKDGNIATVQYFDAKERLLRVANVRWKNGLPAAMKYSDSTQAISWNYDATHPVRKDICIDSFSGKKEDTLVTLRTTKYECEDSINPLHPLANQLLLCHAVAPAVALSPLGELSDAFLHLNARNPFLIKITEKEKTRCQERLLEYERSTTVQYAYYFNGGRYPAGAWVHLHSEGFTKLGSDNHFALEYQYE